MQRYGYCAIPTKIIMLKVVKVSRKQDTVLHHRTRWMKKPPLMRWLNCRGSKLPKQKGLSSLTRIPLWQRKYNTLFWNQINQENFGNLHNSTPPLSIAKRGFLRCVADRFMKNNRIISLQYPDYQYYLEISLSRSFRYFLRFVGKMLESYMLICNFVVLG